MRFGFEFSAVSARCVEATTQSQNFERRLEDFARGGLPGPNSSGGWRSSALTRSAGQKRVLGFEGAISASGRDV
jgi:hypothetical protein